MSIKGNTDKQDSKITCASSSKDNIMGRRRRPTTGRGKTFVLRGGQGAAVCFELLHVPGEGSWALRRTPAPGISGELGFLTVPRAGLLKVLGSCKPSYLLVVEEMELVWFEPVQILGSGIRALAGCEPSLGRPWYVQPALQTHQKSSVQRCSPGPSYPVGSSRMAGPVYLAHDRVLTPGQSR